jgi:primosomal protein N' (replication factor Y) (superfamily II helicase)
MADRWVQVVFALPLAEFTYRLPEGFDSELPWEGRRVKAPFRNGEKEGLRVGLAPIPDEPQKIKTITKVIDERGLFGVHTLATARWMAKQYLCGLGESVSAMVPSARRERDAPPLVAEDDAADHELLLSEEQSEAVEAIAAGTGLCSV